MSFHSHILLDPEPEPPATPLEPPEVPEPPKTPEPPAPPAEPPKEPPAPPAELPAVPEPPKPPAPPEPPKPGDEGPDISALQAQVSALTETLRSQETRAVLSEYHFARPDAVEKAIGDHPEWFAGHKLTEDGAKALRAEIDAIADGYARTTDYRRQEHTPAQQRQSREQELTDHYRGDGVIPWGRLPTDSFANSGR